jgi:hypothetical protein
MQNVTKLARILSLLHRGDPSVKIDPSLLMEVQRLPENKNKFLRIHNDITQLTHQLEKRYRGVLPFHVKPGTIRSWGMKLHVARDPLTSLWRHNDRLERKMLELRKERKLSLEYYFSLNKRLRKELHRLIPAIIAQRSNAPLLHEASLYRDLLRRFVITPRIHQKLITVQDHFAIDTTIFNIHEINEIAGSYGNAGMILALQISMATKAEALIAVDRKMQSRREEILRTTNGTEIPSLRLIPLFEDTDAVNGISNYLDRVWEYALQSRRMNQETKDRFAEIIAEVFIAGSDLSQQVGQPPAAAFYRTAKHSIVLWLAHHGLSGDVRLKLGSGEPMQRQGGYYSDLGGQRAFIPSPDSMQRYSSHLRQSTRKSTEYATTPLSGIFSGGDLRTLQSTIAEQLRYLPIAELAQLLYHMRERQSTHLDSLVRASEPLVESRLRSKQRGTQELERLTMGTKEKAYEDFLTLFTANFRQILYGHEEDVVGLHLISYFIARTTPSLRDRPTVRPRQGPAGNQGQRILERVAETIPFARYGSLLRAIAHNQAQTAVLGINQLTSGLFRAIDRFAEQQTSEGEAQSVLADRIMPFLPVNEILHTLRLYQDVGLHQLKRLEGALPAGNSAIIALHEDNDVMEKYLPYFRQELLRRHGVEVNDFFSREEFIPDLLPTLRPDLAILLQPDLFNTDPEKFFSRISGKTDIQWNQQIVTLLNIPVDIKMWRSNIWGLLEKPVYQRVESFADLAAALHSLSHNVSTKDLPFATKGAKVSSSLSHFFRMTSSDDEMKQFLASAFEYLSVVSQNLVEVPINIVRALKEVEKIASIEEQALSEKEQELLRFYLLQIARLARENG